MSRYIAMLKGKLMHQLNYLGYQLIFGCPNTGMGMLPARLLTILSRELHDMVQVSLHCPNITHKPSSIGLKWNLYT